MLINSIALIFHEEIGFRFLEKDVLNNFWISDMDKIQNSMQDFVIRNKLYFEIFTVHIHVV